MIKAFLSIACEILIVFTIINSQFFRKFKALESNPHFLFIKINSVSDSQLAITSTHQFINAIFGDFTMPNSRKFTIKTTIATNSKTKLIVGGDLTLNLKSTHSFLQ